MKNDMNAGSNPESMDYESTDGVVGLMSPEFAAAMEEQLMASYMAAAVRTKHSLEDIGTSSVRLKGLVDDHLRDVDRRAHASSMEMYKAEGVAFAEGWGEQASATSNRAIDRVLAALFPVAEAPSPPNA